MPHLPKRGAKIRLRGGTSPLWVRVFWPAERPNQILVHFADDATSDDSLLSELCVDPGMLVLSATCASTPDAVAVTEWCTDHAADLDADPDRLFVAGAGPAGRLAAIVALHARDREWPTIAGQILIDPHFEPVPTEDGPYPAPLRARLTGVAPATIVTTTRDDGLRYAERLRRAGIDVDELSMRSLGPVVLLTMARRAVAGRPELAGV